MQLMYGERLENKLSEKRREERHVISLSEE